MTRDQALALHLGGVRHTRAEWDALSAEDQHALVDAGDYLRRHNATLIAQALSNGDAAVMAPADGGESIVMAALSAAIEEVAGG